MGYKIAPDWYWLEAANMADEEAYFPPLELAKQESERYKKEAEKNGTVYEENIGGPLKCLPADEYFIGDPAAVIEDYEDNEKWPVDGNNVFQLDDGTYFALYHANLGPQEYLTSQRHTINTRTGDIIFIPTSVINRKLAISLAQEGEALVVEYGCTHQLDKDEECEGAIEFADFIIFTDHEMWFDDGKD